jgi:hypothetical protein
MKPRVVEHEAEARAVVEPSATKPSRLLQAFVCDRGLTPCCFSTIGITVICSRLPPICKKVKISSTHHNLPTYDSPAMMSSLLHPARKMGRHSSAASMLFWSMHAWITAHQNYVSSRERRRIMSKTCEKFGAGYIPCRARLWGRGRAFA